MKKIILIMAGALCISAAVQAQEPTPQPPKDSTSIQPTQPTAPEAPAYRKDMMKVEATAIPDALKSTLQRPQFKGWETGEIFTNTDKNIYVVEIRDAVENRTKAYRFDAEGKPMKDN